MKLKPIRFSKDGFGKVNTRNLKRIKVAFESGDYERWLMKNDSKEEQEAVKHFAKEIQETLDREVVEAVLKEYEEEKLKKVLEEVSTKIGEKENE